MNDKISEEILYRHVDLYSKKPLSGKKLDVFLNCLSLNSPLMLKIAQETGNFETTFLLSTDDPTTYRAKIFTQHEEIDFSCDSLLGAACVLHEPYTEDQKEFYFELEGRPFKVSTTRKGHHYKASMEFKNLLFSSPLEKPTLAHFLTALNLTESDIFKSLPVQVVSNEIPFLIIPMKYGLEKIKSINPQLLDLMKEIRAKFIYFLQISQMTGRMWDSFGKEEDTATGSAAMAAAAYLVNHKFKEPDTEIIVNQGRFVERPCQISVKISGSPGDIVGAEVSADVYLVGRGSLDNYSNLQGALE